MVQQLIFCSTKKGGTTHLIFQPKHSIFPPKWVSRDWEKRPPKNVVSNLWEFLTSHRTRSRLSSGVELAYTPTFFPQNRWTFVCVRLWKKFEVFKIEYCYSYPALTFFFYQMANFPLLKIQVRGLRQNKGKKFFYEVRNFYWQFALHNADDEEMKDFSGKGKWQWHLALFLNHFPNDIHTWIWFVDTHVWKYVYFWISAYL